MIIASRTRCFVLERAASFCWPSARRPCFDGRRAFLRGAAGKTSFQPQIVDAGSSQEKWLSELSHLRTKPLAATGALSFTATLAPSEEGDDDGDWSVVGEDQEDHHPLVIGKNGACHQQTLRSILAQRAALLPPQCGDHSFSSDDSEVLSLL